MQHAIMHSVNGLIQPITSRPSLSNLANRSRISLWAHAQRGGGAQHRLLTASQIHQMKLSDLGTGHTPWAGR